MSGIRNTTIRKALNSPTSVHSASVTRIASVVPKPCQTNSEMTSAFASEAVDPTERSKPPMVSEMDTPTPITVTMATKDDHQRDDRQQHAPFIKKIEKLLTG